jgi:hypothetical protein
MLPMTPMIEAAYSVMLLQEAVTLTSPARTPLQSWWMLNWYNVCLSLIVYSSCTTFEYWFMKVINSPEEAEEIIVFITIWFAVLSSFEISIAAPAFIKSEVKRMRRVPATSSEILEAK